MRAARAAADTAADRIAFESAAVWRERAASAYANALDDLVTLSATTARIVGDSGSERKTNLNAVRDTVAEHRRELALISALADAREPVASEATALQRALDSLEDAWVRLALVKTFQSGDQEKDREAAERANDRHASALAVLEGDGPGSVESFRRAIQTAGRPPVTPRRRQP
jgi:hypothetical protein